ncbi:MAG: oligosaccharide flippase family protein [Eudoraea sp.]|nr:oligosaccharide flippase family protein [Eudoraea sp.]
MKQQLQNIWNDSDRKEILTKGFSFLTIRTAGLFAGYIFTYLITINYGASVYGLVSLCFSLFIFAGILGRLGTDINLVKFYSDENNRANPGLFYRVLIKSFVAASLLGALLYWGQDLFVVSLFDKPQLRPYILWTALAIPFWSATMVCSGVLRARKQNKWFAFLNNPGRFALATLALIILWAWIDSPVNAIKAHFYGVAAMSVIAFLKCATGFKKVTLSSSWNSWLFIRESLPMMLSSTILVLLGWLDTFVLGIYETDANIGIYNVALKISLLTGFGLQAINSILAPKLAKSHSEGNLNLFKGLIRFSTRINFFSTLIIVVGILIFHRLLLSIFGEEFVSGAEVLIILCVGQLINAMSGSIGEIMLMTGKQIAYQNIMLVALLLNVVLNFTLIPLYGIFGAAIATALSIAFWNLTGAVYLKRKVGVESYYNPFGQK